MRRPQQNLSDIFEPYALELGLLVYAWNHLQDDLARLFSLMFGIGNDAAAFAVWHSTPSDLAQRKMLRAAAEVKLAKDRRTLDEIIWLLDKVDHMLSSKRNNAIHAPVVIKTGIGGATIAPYEMALNPRAAALKDKDIIKELIWYRDTAVELRKFSSALYRAIADDDEPWPNRPTLPHLGQQTRAKEKPPAKPRKEPRPPPATSQD